MRTLSATERTGLLDTNVSAAAGALLLFASVQATMTRYGIGIWIGESLSRMQVTGQMLAGGGLLALLLPGLVSPHDFAERE